MYYSYVRDNYHRPFALGIPSTRTWWFVQGLFFFMQYTTITKINGLHCEVHVYQNHEFWHIYEFHLDRLFIIQGENILTHISCKRWGTEMNTEEIHNAIIKHLLSKCDGNG